MNQTNSGDVPLRGEKPTLPFCWQGKELYDIFLPIIGADCLAVYSYFTSIVFSDPKLRHSVRSLSKQADVGATTVSRSLEILAHLGLVKLIHRRGSRKSECQLLDSREVAKRLGAVLNRRTLLFSMPPEVTRKLRAEVEAIRKRQQGKSLQAHPRRAPNGSGNLPLRVSQRNASVSPAIRQRSTRETQRESHLIQEEGRNEEITSPYPPCHDEAGQKDKDSPDEDEPDRLLKFARAVFTGVMKDMGCHLLDTSRPPNPRYANGYADWEQFGFGSLAVEAAESRGAGLALVLSACDPDAARSGLEKYRRKWDESLRKWFGCKVYCELQDTWRATEC